eukprot:Pgem_evm2s2890
MYCKSMYFNRFRICNETQCSLLESYITFYSFTLISSIDTYFWPVIKCIMRKEFNKDIWPNMTVLSLYYTAMTLDLYSKRIASFVRRWHNNTATIWSVAGGELGKVKFPKNPKEAAKKVAQSATDNKTNVQV